MNNQEAIQAACDDAVKNLVKQGGRCRAKRPGPVPGQVAYNCAYGATDGRHCAIGWVLPWGEDPRLDEYFLTLFDDVNGLLLDWPEEFKHLWPKIPLFASDRGMEIAEALQNFHDQDVRSHRRETLEALQRLGVDTSAPHWHQWIEMAEKG